MKSTMAPSLFRTLVISSAAIAGVEGSKCHQHSSDTLSHQIASISTSSHASVYSGSVSVSYLSTNGSLASTSLYEVSTSLSSSSSASSTASATTLPSISSSALPDTSYSSSTTSESSISTLSLETAAPITSEAVSTATSSSTTDSSTLASTSLSSSSEDLTTSSSASIGFSTSESTISTFNTADYTYYEVTLPVTFTPAESVVTPTTTEIYSITQTPTPTCVIDKSNLDDKFKLAAIGGVRLIPKSGRIGVLTANDFPHQADDSITNQTMAEEENEGYFNNLPTFSFQATDSGPSDYYDLVTFIDGVPVYVALQPASMDVYVSTSSSNGQQPNGDGFVTSIFSFSCDGHIEIGDGSGIVYTWQVGPDGINSVMVEGSPSDDEQILLVPVTMPVGFDANYADSDSTLARRHSRYGSMPELQRRDGPYTDGSQPRVPYSPSHLVSKPRPGARSMQYNGCGSGSTAAWIPQLNFGWCCDMHDYCYDNCQSGQVELCNNQYCSPGEWERCNSAFYDCMHNTACTQYSWFWHPTKRAECELEALFYTAVVMTYKGSDAFKEATSDRCGVFCPDGNQLCHGSCLDYTSSDNNNCGGCGYQCDTGRLFDCQRGHCVCTADTQNDSNNCGGCGNVCPYKTHCNGGSCVCNEDTCGNLCVNLQSHPRNCGSCGNVCSTGYCFDGQCVDATALATSTDSAPTCLPTDAVKNGGFDTIGSSTDASPWQFNADGQGSVTIQYGPASMGSSQSNAATLTLKPTSSVSWLNLLRGSIVHGSLYQNISICPGANYEITFTMKVTQASALGVGLNIYVLDNSIASISQLSSTVQGYGPYPFTVPESTDTFTFTLLQLYFSASWLLSILGSDGTNIISIDDVSVYQV